MRNHKGKIEIFIGAFVKDILPKMTFLVILFCLFFLFPFNKGDASIMKTITAQEGIDGDGKRSWLSGRYLISRKQIVTGATVLVTDRTQGKFYLTSTDEEGIWRLDSVPEGNYVVEIFKEGLEYIKKEEVEVRFPFKTVVELQAMLAMESVGDILRWGGQMDGTVNPRKSTLTNDNYILTGKISSREDVSLLDAEIVIRNLSREANPLRVYSDSNGLFNLEGLSAGLYDLFIMTPGYLPLRAIVSVQTSPHLEAIMLLQPLDYEATPSELIPLDEPIPPR